MLNFAGYLKIAAAAEYLGVSPSTLRNWDRRQKVQATRHPINGYRLYRKKDLDALLLRLQGEQNKRG